ncbi:MAG: sugar nucleotide-binding protein [Alphaproteobacteria bacterium]|nr:sugar nucleotide-binding protein [Alphaproteobacteria bacterium]
MRFLVLGGTGLVGQAVAAEARVRGHDALAAARRGTALALDATDSDALRLAVRTHRPEIVFNCINFGSIEACAARPEDAHRVNAGINGVLAEACEEMGAALVAIGTDHYFTGDGDAKHGEEAAVALVNDYAKSKHAGERLALAYARSLVVRTNVTGFRGWADGQTFIEWALAGLRAGRPMTLFDDYYCSTLDAGSLAAAAIDLVERGARGVFNVACRDVASKQRFVMAFAERLSAQTRALATGSVRSLPVRRAESTGLDVGKAEKALGRALPSFDQAVDTLARLAKDA